MYDAGSHSNRRSRRRPSVELVPDVPPSGGVIKLTPHECEIVALVARGLTNREVAVQLGKSESTVKHRLSQVYRKLGVTRRVRLMMMFRP